MRDGASTFFQIQCMGHFSLFWSIKTEILHIYSLAGQILKHLFPSVSVPSEQLFTEVEVNILGFSLTLR